VVRRSFEGFILLVSQFSLTEEELTMLTSQAAQ
jgi:hypothetical protein